MSKMSINLDNEIKHGNLGNSLVFCQLPPRTSVSNSEEQPRLSYYNGDEVLAVPFRWEASPGKPVADNRVIADANAGFGTPRLLRPPPGITSRRSTTGREDFEYSNSIDSRWGFLSGARVNLVPAQQKSRLPPKIRSYNVPTPQSYNSTKSSSVVHPSSPGHRRGNGSDESFASCGRSDFDWPEVSDDEEYCTPALDHKSSSSRSSGSNSRMGGAGGGSASGASAGGASGVGGAGRTKEELSFSSSRSSFSSSSTVSSPVNSGGGSRGGSARDIMLWRNIVNLAAAQAVGGSHTGVVPCKPPETGESNSEEDDVDDDEKEPQMKRGLFACMPMLSRLRVIHSSKADGHNTPAMIDFQSRLSPGMRNRAYHT